MTFVNDLLASEREREILVSFTFITFQIYLITYFITIDLDKLSIVAIRSI